MTVKGKEYFNYAPEGFDDEHVHVCEYRYNSRSRSFGKMKSWAFTSDRVHLIPRDKPLEPIRVASVFSDRVDNKPVEQEDDAELLSPVDFPVFIHFQCFPECDQTVLYYLLCIFLCRTLSCT